MSDYNGWKNYQTWAVNLWLTNEQAASEFWDEQTANALVFAIGNGDDKAEAATALAEQIESELEENRPEVTGLYADLLTSALGHVDYREIAENWLLDKDVFVAGWNKPGYMPDNEPVMFTDADSALEYLQDEAKSRLDDDETLAGGQYEELVAEVDGWRLAKGEFSTQFRGTVFFVSRQ
jgi:hypothetical protein